MPGFSVRVIVVMVLAVPIALLFELVRSVEKVMARFCSYIWIKIAVHNIVGSIFIAAIQSLHAALPRCTAKS